MNSQQTIQELYPECENIRVITDTTEIKPTRKNILEAIQWLVSDIHPGQHVFFHYSGHGGQLIDKNGAQKSIFENCICPYNNGKLEIITDDEIRVLLANKIPAGSKCFAVIDACNSGTAMDLQYTWQCPKPDSLVFSQNRRYPVTRGNVLFLSACRDEQYAMDTVNTAGVPGGALTFALLSTWATYRFNMKVKHLLWNVRKYLKERGYGQVPQLSSGGAMSSEAILDLSK
jgi:metacaspase-1